MNKEIHMIVGPNGAGKTTLAMQLLPKFLSVHEFLNADEIARGLNPLHPEGQTIKAGRLMLLRFDELVKAGQSFAFETTGASKVFLDKLQQAKTNGFMIGLIFLWLPSPGFAVQRVHKRVELGGHAIPEKDIMRRYFRGLANVLRHYVQIADRAVFLNGTKPLPSTTGIIASKYNNRLLVLNSEIWTLMQEAVAHE